jgi:hypothetical protein
MRGVVVLRRVAQVLVVMSAIGSVAIVLWGDWPDAALTGLLGALALVTARMTTWRLRHGHEWTTATVTASAEINS